MPEKTLNQDYFTEEDIEEIINRIMSFPFDILPSSQETKRISSYKAVKASYALNLIRILRDRLDSKELLSTLYTDETMLPRPLINLVRGYLEGTHTREEIECILNGLQTDMRQYYSTHKIPFADPNTLPKTPFLDLSDIPGFEDSSKHIQDPIDGIRENLESAIQKYVPRINASQKAQEIFDRARQNILGEFDTSSVIKDLAELIARASYIQLMINIGTRDPTPEELANRFASSLEKVYEELSFFPAAIDREKVIKERMQNEVYQRELEAYKKGLDDLFIS